MPALYQAPVAEFLVDHEDFIIGRLATLTQQGFTELSAEQIETWRQQVPILKAALRLDHAREWHLLL